MNPESLKIKKLIFKMHEKKIYFDLNEIMLSLMLHYILFYVSTIRFTNNNDLPYHYHLKTAK